MVKRILAMALALTMVLSFCVISASAELTDNDKRIRLCGKLAETKSAASTGTNFSSTLEDGKYVEYVLYCKNIPADVYGFSACGMAISYNSEAVVPATAAGAKATSAFTAKAAIIYNKNLLVDTTSGDCPGSVAYNSTSWDVTNKVAKVLFFQDGDALFPAATGGFPFSGSTRATTMADAMGITSAELAEAFPDLDLGDCWDEFEILRLRFYVVDATKPMNISVGDAANFALSFTTDTTGAKFDVDQQTSKPYHFYFRLNDIAPISLLDVDGSGNYYAKNSATSESYFFGYVQDTTDAEYGVNVDIAGSASDAPALVRTTAGVYGVSVKNLPVGAVVKAYTKATAGADAELSAEAATIE